MNIRPTGRKGNENINRIKELMNVTPIKEGVNKSTEIITKLGPDGKAYAIIKENSNYFIKVAAKTTGLVIEDFKYIGGLANKMSEAYTSYSSASKQLNMKFIGLAESNEDKVFNILRNDNLLKESTENDGSGIKTDNENSGDNLADGDADDDFTKATADGTKDGNKGTHAEKHVMEDVEMTDDESYIDEMINPTIKESRVNKGISISKAMNDMDNIIESLDSNNKIDNFISTLTESEMDKLVNSLKKKL